MNIKQISDPAFRVYGRVIQDYDTTALAAEMLSTPLPEDVAYVPSVPELEALPEMEAFTEGLYGYAPIQIGYCNGHNQKLNALEYHRSSEINLAVTDLILLVGRQQDITDDFTYDTSLAEAFFVPAGTLLEVYATTLHYAPCQADEKGFRCVVVLPRKTNENLDRPASIRCGEEKLLFAVNKWLIGHPEGGLPPHAWIGLKGENLSVPSHTTYAGREV